MGRRRVEKAEWIGHLLPQEQHPEEGRGDHAPTSQEIEFKRPRGSALALQVTLSPLQPWKILLKCLEGEPKWNFHPATYGKSSIMISERRNILRYKSDGSARSETFFGGPDRRQIRLKLNGMRQWNDSIVGGKLNFAEDYPRNGKLSTDNSNSTFFRQCCQCRGESFVRS